MKRSPQRSLPGTGFGSRPVHEEYRKWYCENGPLKGQHIELTMNGDGKTAVIACNGQVGVYDRGQWVPYEWPTLYVVR